jgi:hypothetical protein
MGCASSTDNSEFGRRRGEIEKDIDKMKSLGGKIKSAITSGNPSQIASVMQTAQSFQDVTTGIPEKMKGLRAHLDTLKNEPDYAKKENQFNQLEKRFEKTAMESAGNMMAGASSALKGLM